MVRAFRIQLLVVVVAVLTAMALAACGGAEEAGPWGEGEFASADAPAAAMERVVVEREVVREVPVEVFKIVEVPGETVAVEKQVLAEVVGQTVAVENMMALPEPPASAGMPGPAGSPGSPGPVGSPADLTGKQAADAAGPDQSQVQLVTQRRIIIREVDIDLVVDDIQSTMDRIVDMAADAGGWVVDSGRSSLHSGRISFRVPSDRLESTIEELRGIASKVRSELTTSRDVTDEYVDLGARLKNQQATEEALLALLERAQSVEDALAVQRNLMQVQEEIERLSGRIKLLEETSAFSLIRVELGLAPAEMDVDSGVDQTVAARVPVRFRATFSPPEGIEDYVITWDFGDGSNPVTVNRTAPTQVTGQLITATVTHSYGDPTGSPFIAQVMLSGTGEGGVVEGEDTLTVSVSEVPAIEVFAGERKFVDQNTVVEFSGSFTRPKGLTNVRYEWDFGDGSTPVEGDLLEGITRAEGTHTYPDHRREPYVARLIVTADSEVGEVEASGRINIFVREQVGFVVAGFDLGGNFKTAVRGFTALLQGLSVVVMWLAIFSPIWGVVAVVGWFLVRRLKRRSAENRAGLAAKQQAAAEQMAEAGEQSAGDSD